MTAILRNTPGTFEFFERWRKADAARLERLERIGAEARRRERERRLRTHKHPVTSKNGGIA